jgi:hypothetical protein
MMAIGLFCEDIREEKQGTNTLIGILPDNMVVQALGLPEQSGQPFFPKLALYVRINVGSETHIDTLSVKLRLPDGSVLDLTVFDKELIEKSRLDAPESPFMGLISKAVFGPTPMPVNGRFEAIVELNGSETVCGFLNVKREAPEMRS